MHFAVLAADKLPYLCIQAVGGTLPARPQYPVNIIFLALCFIAEAWQLSALAGHSEASKRLLALTIVTMFSAGAIATCTENFVLWVIMLALGCGAHLKITARIVITFSSADRHANNPFTRRLLTAMLPVFVFLWFSFPALWLVSQLSLVSTTFEFIAFALVSMFAKYNIAAVLVFGSFSQQQADIETEIAALDAQREQAENRNTAKRLFMR
jgi:bacteriorhodopsin